MKTLNYLAISAIVTCFSGTAFAKDSDFRVTLASGSIAMDIGRDLEAYGHAEGPGRATSLGNLSALLAERIPSAIGVASAPVHSGEDHSMLQGNGWTLDVRGDGNWVRYTAETHGGPQVPVDKRMVGEELEALGRRFIAENLSAQIVMTPDERLEVWRTSYEVSAGAVPGGAVERKVVSNRIVFTRVIGGTAVVGPGSKIAVTFDNDRKIVGFQYDWSPLIKSKETQTSASPAVVKSRLGEIVARKTRSGSNLPLEHVECGYYDAGALGGAKAKLEAGCVAEHVFRQNGMKSVIVSAVPAMEKMQGARADWPETSMISK